MRSCTGIGIAVPPSYLEPVFRKYSRVLRLLRRIDNGISHLPLLRTIGDHMLVALSAWRRDAVEPAGALPTFFLRTVEIIFAQTSLKTYGTFSFRP